MMLGQAIREYAEGEEGARAAYVLGLLGYELGISLAFEIRRKVSGMVNGHVPKGAGLMVALEIVLEDVHDDLAGCFRSDENGSPLLVPDSRISADGRGVKAEYRERIRMCQDAMYFP